MNTEPPTPHPMHQPPAPIYAGVDIAKATLQLHCQTRPHLLDNTPAGCAQRLALVRAAGNVQLVCEATGNYEQGLLRAAHAAGQPVSVLNPAQVRYFALAQGQRAKNDPLRDWNRAQPGDPGSVRRWRAVSGGQPQPARQRRGAGRRPGANLSKASYELAGPEASVSTQVWGGNSGSAA